MNTFAIVAPYILLVLVIFSAAYLLHLQRQGNNATVAALERLLAKRDEEYKDLADRSFLAHRQPPTGVNVAAEREEHQDRIAHEREARRTAPPRQFGSVNQARQQMALNERDNLRTFIDAKKRATG